MGRGYDYGLLKTNLFITIISRYRMSGQVYQNILTFLYTPFPSFVEERCTELVPCIGYSFYPFLWRDPFFPVVFIHFVALRTSWALRAPPLFSQLLYL
jgi:hypothetical protein